MSLMWRSVRFWVILTHWINLIFDAPKIRYGQDFSYLNTNYDLKSIYTPISLKSFINILLGKYIIISNIQLLKKWNSEFISKYETHLSKCFVITQI